MASNLDSSSYLSPSMIGSGIMSSSLSSLSSSVSSARHPSSSNISKAYRQASTLFLTRRLPEALSTVLPLITPSSSEFATPGDVASGAAAFDPAPVAKASRSTRIKVWSLYLTILNAILELNSDEGKDAFGTQEWRALCHKVREGEVWEEVVRSGYHGSEGDVDADVVINLATLLLGHAKTQTLNQKRLENYLAAARTPNLDLTDRLSGPSGPGGSSASPARRLRSSSKSGVATGHGADTPRDLNARVKILELYTLHVLPRNDEWACAREFINMSAVLDDERKEAFIQALDSLKEDQEEAERKAREKEDAIRKDIENARKLRAENEERERKRLEEERQKREAAGVNASTAASAGSGPTTEGESGVEAKGTGTGTTKKPNLKKKASALKNGGASSSSASSKPARPSRKGASSPTATKTTGSSSSAVTGPGMGTKAALILNNIRSVLDQVMTAFHGNPFLLYRTLAFIIGFLLMFSKKSVRERITRVVQQGWGKVKATAGMGMKVSYI
ncbi:hypothetical protein GE21DRAFT_4663 [Neurospora crassa]|uniref:Peroxin-26 Pex26-Penicillium chrysogenum n=1 Tax=Neurospora crassa (strain ATCC 24698 / 74-OR23-1A / CBS 708.71 / DSM 1257 / FGSC 987) TaxID=367110 RepID=Q7RZL8_NEUCR|nr:peroxin-26 Pex26-Penicillium chrysogenum [Neurospora crassa OR74A]EAA28582.1 peroxin-26 Pex26-Penicillium chrysogenum [Neurospora crassa OR74A]KHE89547.1 hypothetical protein GE21DRAFT_4663 [Neurospora crassa]|eukprot:XP_957818.1 peroxin-26 Pex26-Penicillium chrysogenum [Neurospora crassa OR74A]